LKAIVFFPIFINKTSAAKAVILSATERYGKVIFHVEQSYYKNLQQPPHLLVKLHQKLLRR
jgi:hypothetical protein